MLLKKNVPTNPLTNFSEPFLEELICQDRIYLIGGFFAEKESLKFAIDGFSKIREEFWDESQMLHVRYIYLHNWVIFRANVCKYSIHGSYGNEDEIYPMKIFFQIREDMGLKMRLSHCPQIMTGFFEREK